MPNVKDHWYQEFAFYHKLLDKAQKEKETIFLNSTSLIRILFVQTLTRYKSIYFSSKDKDIT